MVDTRSLLEGFLGGGGRRSEGGGGIGSLGGGESSGGGIGSLGGGGGSLRDVLGGLFGGSGGGIGSLGSGGGGGGLFGGPIGSMGGDDRPGSGGIFGGPIGSLGDGSRGGGGLFGGSGGGIGSLGGDDAGRAYEGRADEGRGGGIGSLGGMLGGGGGGMGGMLGGAMGTAAAGGLLGSLLGGGRRRSSGGGGLLRMGGMAVLGTLAYRAWKQFQESQGMPQATEGAPAGSPAATTPGAAPAGPWTRNAGLGGAVGHAAAPEPAEFARDEVPAADGQPFGLSVIKAMISAAKADGHMDATERDRVFDEVERLGLDPEAKGFVFQALDAPADPSAVAAMARTDAQKTEIYMASRLVAEPDTAAERAYLDALAHRLGLAPGLRQSLDAQAMEAGQIVAAEAAGNTPKV
ncbi:tellurite resistance TerB family protein [Roseomonas sp. WA12]